MLAVAAFLAGAGMGAWCMWLPAYRAGRADQAEEQQRAAAVALAQQTGDQLVATGRPIDWDSLELAPPLGAERLAAGDILPMSESPASRQLREELGEVARVLEEQIDEHRARLVPSGDTGAMPAIDWQPPRHARPELT